MSTTSPSASSRIPAARDLARDLFRRAVNPVWEADARNNLAWFIEYDGRGAWQPVPHLLLLCAARLNPSSAANKARLMVFLPPRHGKIHVVSKKFPAWYLGRNPDKEISSAPIRLTWLMIFPALPGTHSASGGQSCGNCSWPVIAALWGVGASRGHTGGLVAAGVGGPITGRGAHVAIIDDPFKNYEEAASETVREKVLNWYKSTLRTRLAPGGAIVLVMTRWHEKDLAGELEAAMTEEDGEQWEIIELPAIAKGNDILGRQPGEPLWPARYPLSRSSRLLKIALGSYLWSTLPAEAFAGGGQQVQAGLVPIF
jgi:hypothetical protein